VPTLSTDVRRNVIGTGGSALVTAVVGIGALYFAREVFVPLALAGLLAFLLAPAATRLERWGLPRVPSALLVIVLCVAGFGALGWVVLGQVYNLAIELPQYQQNLTGKINSLHLNSAGKLSSTVSMLSGLEKQISGGGEPVAPIVPVAQSRRTRPSPAVTPVKPAEPIAVKVEEPDQSLLTVATRSITPLVHPLATAFIVVIFLVFMLLGREDLRERGIRLAGSGRMHVTTTAIEDASRRVSRYLQMQLVVNLSYGTVVGLALWAIGLPHPLLWGVLTCLLRFVPYVGILMASAGPLLLAFAVSPEWKQLIWTMVIFGLLEIMTANFAEPMLYGDSTGISAIAILIAAIFWTVLWGLPGLFLSTPLTVCLIVIGRQVPQLRFLEVLFGQEPDLPPSERFYQRLLISNSHEAKTLISELLKLKSRETVYDEILIPALAQIEEAKHAEEITVARADELLQTVEELAEDSTSQLASIVAAESKPRKRVFCVPARDFADEVASQLALQVLADVASTRVLSADCSTPDILQTLESQSFDAICVTGVPPRALRHIRMRCHQIRARFPDAVVVACVLTKENELSNLRSRVPTEDAQHVVCSLQLLKDYLRSILMLATPAIEARPETEEQIEAGREIGEAIHQIQQADVFDEPGEEIFSRLAANLAKSFDAPISLITVKDGRRKFWEAQCGLPEDTLQTATSERDLSICSRMVFSDSSLVISDTMTDERFAEDGFLLDRGIRFYAGAPLKSHEGEVIGSLCVLDTRPRTTTDEQREMLVSIANSVMTAIELHAVGSTSEKVLTSAEL
jgi:predicted PurR-regulated permease PerM/GAF domain-containing protein